MEDPGAAPSRNPLAILFYVAISLRLSLTVLWIRFCKFISSADHSIKKTSKHHHKVVIIGDGFAEGIGDWVVMGGLSGVARHLEKLWRKDDRVRTGWEIVNRGRAGSTTADWVPEPPQTGKTQQTLYQKKACSKACSDAEVFVVMAGSMDVVKDCVGMPMTAMKKTSMDTYEEEELCETTKNLRAICETLRKEGKRVLLCNLPTDGAGIGKKLGVVKRINRQLYLYAKSTAPPKTKKSPPPGWIPPPPAVTLVKLNDARIMRPYHRCFDGLHLNSKGYKHFANTVYDQLGLALVATEWNALKGMLNFSSVADAQAEEDPQASEGERPPSSTVTEESAVSKKEQ